MEQQVHFVTVATADLDAARRFYVDGLDWSPTLDVPGEILFFQIGPGIMLGLFDAAQFTADLGPGDLGAAHLGAPADVTPRGFTLSHNVSSPQEVDRVLAAAAAAGAAIRKPGQPASLAATTATSPTRTACSGRSPTTPAGPSPPPAPSSSPPPTPKPPVDHEVSDGFRAGIGC